ncbi:Abortive infection protein [Beutenbergia cavernae DSM 12333]|uniref:Abortive infection protein n=1 Tax=Beutenbergia cavernae (strain ATCC BAA-8 / DSM 12333 / CCUG 43141 / JCM 11478 / NBRC 16432 / NCIMB 13614 / HKI 0122) TaxID=471853 RepID=C5C5C9_BEUC1|nr:CPBP family intramembrane glutamic endopeptidase [Beutenbergia cavernae]ACQ82269.1 Abortive infection protein [Beutenbergia cavernae DSM 12333]
MATSIADSPWRTFWNRGGVWRAVLLAVVYLAIYLAAGLLAGTLFRDQLGDDDVFATPMSVFAGLTFALIIGAIVLTAFLASVRWFGPVFGPQPIGGRAWMWVIPVLVAVPIVLRLAGIDYESYASGVVLVTLLSGLLIGFCEEVLCRGIVVKMLRDGGRSEWTVMAVSSLIFALLHSANLLAGMAPATVALTIVYTFGFGACMYLTLRVTGRLIWPIVLHGLFDPTLFLATGGIDAESGEQTSSLLALAAPFNFVFIAAGLVALLVVRGRVQRVPEPQAA